MTAKRSRSDSATSAVAAMRAAGVGPIKAPKFVNLRPGDKPFWDSIVRARARDSWTDSDLVLAGNLTTDIGAISGQPNIPLVLCQMSSWTTKNVTTSYVPHEQLQAALENPTKFICAGPKYWLDYHTDGVHLTGKGSVQLGAMHRAAAAAVIARKTWLPTYCTKAVRSGVVVTLSFHTPVGALVRDTANVTDPGNLGLRWIDSTSSATVLSAQVNGNNTVTLTLSGVPTGSNPRVGIADVGISGALGGPTTGPRSCLRDSNTELDVFGNPFYNWACHQIISVE